MLILKRLLSRRGVLNTGMLAAAMSSPVRADSQTSPKAGDAPAAGSLPHTVDVRQFGAKGDGATNDAPAFNAAISFIREHGLRIAGFNVLHKLVIPYGVYLVTESINLTMLRGINTVIDGDGSVIVGRCPGEPVIDAMGSRWLTIRDLTILGDGPVAPRLGLQIGRMKNGVVADDHRFDNVKIIGQFSQACLLNVAAETSQFDHLLLWNHHSNPKSYCLIQDGLDHFAVTSKFVSMDGEAKDRDNSFNENAFINCDFRHEGAGTPVWLGDTARHRFIRCYAAGSGDAAFVVYCGNNSHSMLEIDCHCETEKLKHVFRFTGSRRNPPLRGFRYQDHRCFASGSVFTRDAQLGMVALDDADIAIGGFHYDTAKVVDSPSGWTMTGRYSAAAGSQWNVGSFAGSLFIGSEVTVR